MAVGRPSRWRAVLVSKTAAGSCRPTRALDLASHADGLPEAKRNCPVAAASGGVTSSDPDSSSALIPAASPLTHALPMTPPLERATELACDCGMSVRLACSSNSGLGLTPRLQREPPCVEGALRFDTSWPSQELFLAANRQRHGRRQTDRSWCYPPRRPLARADQDHVFQRALSFAQGLSER
jgi:hypothetical protein